MAWSSWRDAFTEADEPPAPSKQADLHPGREVTPDPEVMPPQYAPGDPGPPRPGTEVRVPLTPRSYEEWNA